MPPKRKVLSSGLKSFPPYLLRCAADIVSSRTEQFIRESLNQDLDTTSLVILLACAEGNLSQSEVANIAQLNPNSMVKKVDALERAHFVRRVRNQENRREHILTLTSKSEQLLDKAQKLLAKAYCDLLAPLREADIDKIASTCEQIVNEDDCPEPV
jgi:DNA-binding MarR family transcriptional regulator